MFLLLVSLLAILPVPMGAGMGVCSLLSDGTLCSATALGFVVYMAWRGIRASWHGCRGWLGSVRIHKSSIFVLADLVLMAAACSDASEEIEGTWYWTQTEVYVGYGDDGRISVSYSENLASPIESGTYTFDGETLTVNNGPDSRYCASASVTWTVEFSDDGEEADMTFVEDSCQDAVRSQNMVVTRVSS